MELIKEASPKAGVKTGLQGKCSGPPGIINYPKQEKMALHISGRKLSLLTIPQEEENSLSHDSPANQRQQQPINGKPPYSGSPTPPTDSLVITAPIKASSLSYSLNFPVICHSSHVPNCNSSGYSE